MFALYLITDDTRPEQIPGAVAEALSLAPPGQVAVQLRAKQCSSRELLALATVLREITQQRGGALIINDRLDVAQLVRADGVQLPEAGLPVAAVRALLGPEAMIGVSCHDGRGLARALDAGATFATLSPVFASPGKGAPLGIAQFAVLTRASALPIYALGGVQPEHVPQLRAAGARGVAVISAVFAASDRAVAVARFLDAGRSG